MHEHTLKQDVVLGTLLLSPECIDDIRGIVTPSDFIGWRSDVYRAICTLADSGDAINLVTVTDELRDIVERYPRVVADVSRLTSVAETAKSAAAIARRLHADTIRDTFIAEVREALEAADHGERFEDTIVSIRAAVDATDIGPSDYSLLASHIDEQIAVIREREKLDTDIVGIETGLANLDHYTLGLQPSELVIVAARASIGKTALALTIAAHTSKAVPTGFISLEMSVSALSRRLLSMWSGIDTRRIVTGRIRPNDIEFNGAVTEARRRQLYIMDRPNANLIEVEQTIRRMVRKSGVRLVFVDYVGLITLSGDRKKHELLDEVVRRLKQLTRELEIPIIALAQLNRESEGRNPTLANIKDSGAYEEHGDVVIFLNRDRTEQLQASDDRPLSAKLIVAKNRNGETGVAKVRFHQRYTLFEDHNPWVDITPPDGDTA
jgi:replicative DNA helicase